MSIFDETSAIIDRCLFGPRPVKYQQVTALRFLAEHGVAGLDGAALVHLLYEHTVQRWRDVNGRFPRRASSENWRFTLNTKISEQNASREKQVEKRIALLEEQRSGGNEWANQVPVASGLLDHKADKKACIDLAHRIGPGCFDLIELKMDEGSGHAIFAAMEALRYGVLYLFSRRWARELGYVMGGSGLLGAQRVRLIVLAPAAYYRGVSRELLVSLRDALSLGLAAECARAGPAGLIMELDFEQFGDSFHWPCRDEHLIEAVLQRHTVTS